MKKTPVYKIHVLCFCMSFGIYAKLPGENYTRISLDMLKRDALMFKKNDKMWGFSNLGTPCLRENFIFFILGNKEKFEEEKHILSFCFSRERP